MGKFYYTYVLQSLKDNKFYIGWTDDLKKRIDKHQQGLVKSTKNRLPIKLVYFEACLSKNKAIKREKQLKTGFGRKFLKERI
jgi:putative endonuclease